MKASDVKIETRNNLEGRPVPVDIAGVCTPQVTMHVSATVLIAVALHHMEQVSHRSTQLLQSTHWFSAHHRLFANLYICVIYNHRPISFDDPHVYVGQG